MEKVILTTSQFNQLAFHHPTLATSFYGTVPCDGLPSNPDVSRPRGYIVNTDPAGQPGQHWLGVWTEGNACEVFDSFALDLDTYGTTEPLQTWLRRHFKYVTSNGQSVQSLHNQSCGGHALMFLVAKIARAESDEFPPDVVSSRLRGQRSSRGTVGQRLDFQGTTLATRRLIARRTRHLSFSGRRASLVLRSSVLLSLVNNKSRVVTYLVVIACSHLSLKDHVTNDRVPISYPFQRVDRGSIGIWEDGVHDEVTHGQSRPLCHASEQDVADDDDRVTTTL